MVNWYVVRWLVLYIVILAGAIGGSFALLDAVIDEAPVKCFEGVFVEQVQPDVPTTYVMNVWLCGIGMKYEFIEPDKTILNQRDIFEGAQ